jgi:long-subunit acyl-CoA synthetase (AMP-forming)
MLFSAFSCPVLQGYGLTETCGCICVGDLTDLNSADSCGPPQCANEIKLVS